DEEVVIDFELQPMGKIYRKSFLLHNVGSLKSSFVVTRDLPTEFEIKPMQGEVPPRGFLAVQISFAPRTPDKFEFPVKFISHNQRPLQIKVRGRGGVGVLGLQFL